MRPKGYDPEYRVSSLAKSKGRRPHAHLDGLTGPDSDPNSVATGKLLCGRSTAGFDTMRDGDSVCKTCEHVAYLIDEDSE